MNQSEPKKKDASVLGLVLGIVVTYLWVELALAWSRFKIDYWIPSLKVGEGAQLRLEAAKK